MAKKKINPGFQAFIDKKKAGAAKKASKAAPKKGKK